MINYKTKEETDIIPRHNSLISENYKQLHMRRVTLLTALLSAVLIIFCIDVAVGSSTIALSEVLKAMLFPEQVDLGTQVIVREVRLPYSIMAVLVGAALSLAGTEMQTILNNPLASPFTLGVSAASSFGASLAIIAGLSIPGIPQEWMIATNAFVFAFGSVMLLQLLSRMQGAGVESLVLFGIALVFTFNAFIGLMQYVASAEALQQLVFWSLGSLSRANWDSIRILGVVLVVIFPLSWSASWQMTTLRLGEDSARSYGVNVRRLRFLSLLRVSMLAACSVAFVGTIGFIGLVGPHIAKMLIGEDHRYSLPAGVLTGALVMSMASIASKALVPGVIMPVGIVTSLIGVPVFIFLIFRKGKKTWK